ncbi:hypothetical protein [Cerasicoccus arenae]|uniref:DUF5067 domain-containing protein n=1 Tax=Cerasicoccus arenae TaxID=424488 RepID=A0A8J3DIV2_9BACT|nr:hypothetical protein [Cerasicoccus arenae]MBK1859993.1 hypothetical protein [Cerasicoccus arenae]GHC13243.1 hypothetical protein GCM10007047_33220 [Cerasicoccus arenae]
MNISSSLKIVSLALLGFAPFGAYAAASGDNTAAHTKAYAEELEGEKVSLDVVFIRLSRHAPEDVPYVFFWAMTIDDDAHSGGGAILVVADKDDKDALIRKYGTNLDRDRGEGGPEHKSLRGTVRIVERKGKSRHVYLDVTDSGVDLSNAPDGLLDDSDTTVDIDLPPGKGPRGGGMGGNLR